MTKTYKISKVSTITNLPISTLRYYEKINLLNPKRDSNNYRVFTDRDLRWIKFIERGKKSGIKLTKIIEYERLRKRGDSTIDKRIEILNKQKSILNQQQNEIQEHINFLENKIKHYKSYKKKMRIR